jgi:hypothetical protein
MKTYTRTKNRIYLKSISHPRSNIQREWSSMGSPYLSKGESITLTTHRIGVESVPYDVMLTTHRLTLIDSRYARFEPLMIAFEDILTVKSGSASTGEPVIILTYTGADENIQVMNLIFMQQPGEHRKHERDIWVKKLMESIIAGREKPAETEEEPIPEPGAIKASIRRWVAPEGIALHTPFASKQSEQPEITIIPDDEGALSGMQEFPVQEGFFEDKDDSEPASPEMAGQAWDRTEYSYGGTDEDGEDGITSSVPEDLDPLQKFQTIVIPFKSLETPTSNNSPGNQKTGEEPQKISEDVILAAVRSIVPEEGSSHGEDKDSNAKMQAGADSGSGMITGDPADALSISGPVEEEYTEERQAPESSRIISEEPLMNEPTEEPPATETEASSLPEKSLQEIRSELKKPGDTIPVSGGPAETAVSTAPVREQRDGRKDPHSPGAPPAGSFRGSIRIILIIMGILVLTGIFVVIFSYTGNGGTVQGTSVVPAVTGEPDKSPEVLTIPALGAGFRVIYEGDFAGEIGNPGQMKAIYGTGDTFFPVQKYNGLVQASIQKQDNTGKTLTLEVYNDAKMIYTRNVSTPGGALDILIDTRTGTIAGMTPTKAVSNETGQNRPMYF